MRINGYRIVSESVTPSILYHGSDAQNLKVVDPRSNSVRSEMDSDRVYLSPSRQYASAFTFPWTDEEGFSLGQINNENIVFEIPRKFKSRVMAKAECSIYVVQAKNTKRIDRLEYYTDIPIDVVDEIQYSSPYEAMKSSGLIIRWR